MNDLDPKYLQVSNSTGDQMNVNLLLNLPTQIIMLLKLCLILSILKYSVFRSFDKKCEYDE